MIESKRFDRDLSWLSFNGRILDEASKKTVPLLERINFLAIFSSNLDEFYRVRMPAIALAKTVGNVYGSKGPLTQPQMILEESNALIKSHLALYGQILTQDILPALKQNNIHLLYNEAIPERLRADLKVYFLTQVLAYIQKAFAIDGASFFPENNKLYFAVTFADNELCIINIPSDKLPRFSMLQTTEGKCVIFLDDVIRANAALLFPDRQVTGIYSLKITRDAAMDLRDEYEGDIAEKIEAQIVERDLGFVSRVLYQPGISLQVLQKLMTYMGFHQAELVAGGNYHHLRDFFGFPVKANHLSYEKWIPFAAPGIDIEKFYDALRSKDSIIHTPYHDYGKVLRFFNEAATDTSVTEVYTTLYRVAGDSKIANALITAARNGKKVTVFVELKARFDEANNLKWSKQMKAAGVKIIYSIPGLKVHAKVALVKRREQQRIIYYGLLSTGNLNESTATVYTDHILFTTNHQLLAELELLFIFLTQRRKPENNAAIKFKHLLVAQFNLQQHFLQLIDRAIAAAKSGQKTTITIKLNNLEESVLIQKLYEASCAGVEIKMIVRSICCLVPGVPGMSENITVTRIVDRYLEHGRIFIFHIDGNEEIYMGSADWMNRNIYRRIEVCFPVQDEDIKAEIRQIITLLLNDNMQATLFNQHLENEAIPAATDKVHAQKEIYLFLKDRS